MGDVNSGVNLGAISNFALYAALVLVSVILISAFIRSADFRRDVILTLLLLGVILVVTSALGANIGLFPDAGVNDPSSAKTSVAGLWPYVIAAVAALLVLGQLIRSAEFRREVVLFLLLGGLFAAGIGYLAAALGLQFGVLSVALLAAAIVIYIRKTWLF